MRDGDSNAYSGAPLAEDAFPRTVANPAVSELPSRTANEAHPTLAQVDEELELLVRAAAASGPSCRLDRSRTQRTPLPSCRPTPAFDRSPSPHGWSPPLPSTGCRRNGSSIRSPTRPVPNWRSAPTRSSSRSMPTRRPIRASPSCPRRRRSRASSGSQRRSSTRPTSRSGESARAETSSALHASIRSRCTRPPRPSPPPQSAAPRSNGSTATTSSRRPDLPLAAAGGSTRRLSSACPTARERPHRRVDPACDGHAACTGARARDAARAQRRP